MQRLLDLGADPTWVAPNGYSVLEHVIWRCWNGDVVDLVASRVQPRQAFWIAAGLGDAEALKRYVDERGVPTEAARQNRPDFTALGYMPMPTNPAPDDHGLIWEAFLVAVFNRRFAVLDVLLDRGFPIDYAGWGSTALHLAVGNGWVEMVEYLVRRGADVNLKGWRPHLSPREVAEQRFLNPHGASSAERILATRRRCAVFATNGSKSAFCQRREMWKPRSSTPSWMRESTVSPPLAQRTCSMGCCAMRDSPSQCSPRPDSISRSCTRRSGMAPTRFW
jgi:hypothetical protein